LTSPLLVRSGRAGLAGIGVTQAPASTRPLTTVTARPDVAGLTIELAYERKSGIGQC